MPREGFASRLGAALIDGMILQICLAPFLIIIVKNLLIGVLFATLIPCTDGRSEADAAQSMSRASLALGVAYLVVLCYSATDVCFAGTPGKLLLGLRIRDRDGQPARRSQLAGRWAIKYSWLVPYGIAVVTITSGEQFHSVGAVLLWIARIDVLLVGLGFLQTLRPERLAFHDVTCGTAVYRLAPSSPGA